MKSFPALNYAKHRSVVGSSSVRSWWTLGLLLAACSSGNTESPVVLSNAVALSVGGRPTPTELVRWVSAQQGISPELAASALAEDALFAVEMEHGAADQVAYLKRLALARTLSEALLREAVTQGPPSDEELQRFTALHWWELDRPALVRTTHAVVLVKEPSQENAARALAEKIRQVSLDAGTKERFRESVEALPAQGLEFRVEDLLPVAADGRAVDPSTPPKPGASVGRYTAEYAAAAHQLQTPGEVSAVVRSPFGFHVLLLTERLSEERKSVAVRRELLSREIYDARARDLERALLQQARREVDVHVELSALTQTEGLTFDR